MRRVLEVAEPVVYIGVIVGGAWVLDPASFFVVVVVATGAVWARLVCQTW